MTDGLSPATWEAISASQGDSSPHFDPGTSTTWEWFGSSDGLSASATVPVADTPISGKPAPSLARAWPISPITPVSVPPSITHAPSASASGASPSSNSGRSLASWSSSSPSAPPTSTTTGRGACRSSSVNLPGTSPGSVSRMTRAGKALEDSGVGGVSILLIPCPGTTSLHVLEPTLARRPDAGKHSSGAERGADRGRWVREDLIRPDQPVVES